MERFNNDINQFRKDLKEGQRYEKIVAEWLSKVGYEEYNLSVITYNKSRSYTKLKGWDYCLSNPEGTCKVFVENKIDKDEYMNISNGNWNRFFIETEYKNKLSGINTTQASLWCHFISTTNELWYGNVQEIKNWMIKKIQENNTKALYKVTSKGNTSGYSVSMKELLKEDSPFYCVNILTGEYKEKTSIIEETKNEDVKCKQLF